jgi:hypothetical protein
MNASPQNQQASLNHDFAIGRVISENALVINRAGGIVPGARPGWRTRAAVTCQAAINHLAPNGHKDETGFLYGCTPMSNIAKL